MGLTVSRTKGAPDPRAERLDRVKRGVYRRRLLADIHKKAARRNGRESRRAQELTSARETAARLRAENSRLNAKIRRMADYHDRYGVCPREGHRTRARLCTECREGSFAFCCKRECPRRRADGVCLGCWMREFCD